MKSRSLILLTLSIGLLTGCEIPSFNFSSLPISSSDESSQIQNSSTNQTSSSSSSNKTSSSNQTSSSSSTAASSSVSSYTTSQTVDTKWQVNFEEYGETFRNSLQKLMAAKKRKTASYDDNKTLGPAAAAYPNKNSNTFVPFYHTTDTLVTYASCNREHTWPNSRGVGKSGPGADPFVIRPTLTSENSDRGNSMYSESGGGGWDPASCGFEGARGESARAIFYCATMYYSSHGLQLGNTPSVVTKTMGRLDYLIKWNNKYPVTDMERQINDYLSDNGYGRNPFVDHPEYANYIWTETGFRTTKVENGGGTSYSSNPAVSSSAITSSSTAQSSTSYDPDALYTLESDINQLNGNTFVISYQSSDTAGVAMSSSAKSSTTPWYLTSINVSYITNKTGLLSSDSNLAKLKFTKLNNGNYTLYNEGISCYLYNYTVSKNSKTYYSIAYDSTCDANGDFSNEWVVTSSGTGFTLVGAKGVNLQYSSNYGTWQGASSGPTTIHLYY